MQAASMTSQVQSIRSLIAQVSGLIGLLVFLNQAWGYAPLDRTILTAFGAGLATYVVLVLGYATVQRILAYTPDEDEDPAPRSDAGANAAASDPATSPKAATDQSAPPSGDTASAAAPAASNAAASSRQAA